MFYEAAKLKAEKRDEEATETELRREEKSSDESNGFFHKTVKEGLKYLKATCKGGH